MAKRSRILLALSAFLCGGAFGLGGQVIGLPVRNAGIPTGISIAADLGFPNADAGKGNAYALTGTLGLGPLGVSVTVGRFSPADCAFNCNVVEGVNTVGATANIQMFGGPLVPLTVTLQVGASRSSIVGRSGLPDASAIDSVKRWHVPVGVGFALTIPSPVFSIRPWLAPRIDALRNTGTRTFSGNTTSGSSSESISQTQVRFGLSAGVDLGLLNGLGFRVAYDRVKAAGTTPSIISVGASFAFKVGL